MNIFEQPSTQAEADTKAPVSVSSEPPTDRALATAERTMRDRYWTKALMTGALLEQWQRLYAATLHGAQSAEDVQRAASLADYAFLLQMSRANTK